MYLYVYVPTFVIRDALWTVVSTAVVEELMRRVVHPWKLPAYKWRWDAAVFFEGHCVGRYLALTGSPFGWIRQCGNCRGSNREVANTAARRIPAFP